MQLWYPTYPSRVSDEGTSKIRMNRKSIRTFRRLERLYLQNFSVILDFRVPMYVETQDRSIPFQVFACEPDRMVRQASLFRPDRTESRQTTKMWLLFDTFTNPLKLRQRGANQTFNYRLHDGFQVLGGQCAMIWVFEGWPNDAQLFGHWGCS